MYILMRVCVIIKENKYLLLETFIRTTKLPEYIIYVKGSDTLIIWKFCVP